VDSHRELLERYDEATALIDRSLVVVQEKIPGDGTNQFSYGALCIEGRPIASVIARRRRQYPVEFGRSSSYVETIEQPCRHARHRQIDVGEIESHVADRRAVDIHRAGGPAETSLDRAERGAQAIGTAACPLHEELGRASEH